MNESIDHIHGIYPPALEKQEPKPFLWSDKKHVREVTWIVVLGIATVMAVALLSAGVWCAQKLGVLG